MEIREFYSSFEPKLNYADHVQSILRDLPESITSGLGSVLLRDSSSVTRKEARRPLTGGASLREVSGVYYRSHGGSPARIELFLDTIIDIWPKWALHVPFLRYEIVGRVLFHELGHHVYAKQHPSRPANEEAASEIGKALLSKYLKMRYKNWLPVIYPIRLTYDLISMFRRSPTHD